jgi:DNA polymerase I
VAGKGAKQVGFNQVTVETASEYAAEDADITLQLHQTLYPQVQQDNKLDFIYSQIEMPSMEVLFTVERNGVLIDANMLNAQSNEIGMKLVALENQAYELAGQPFNLGSPKQLQEILFGKLGIKPTKKTPSWRAQYRRGRIARTSTGPPATQSVAGISRASQAQIHLYRQTPQND